jgi:hypothetical protein
MCLKTKENCLNFVVFTGESGKEYPACVVFMREPNELLCKECSCFCDLEGNPCDRQPREKE